MPEIKEKLESLGVRNLANKRDFSSYSPTIGGKKYHIVFFIIDKKTGEFYIAKHSTDNIHDNYFGSGNWIKSKSPAELAKLWTEIIHWSDSEEMAWTKKIE